MKTEIPTTEINKKNKNEQILKNKNLIGKYKNKR